MFYTNDIDQVKKSKNMFNTIWKTALIPSKITFNSIENIVINTFKPSANDFTSRFLSSIKGVKYFKDGSKFRELSEKDVLQIIIQAKKSPIKKFSKEVVRQYGAYGRAIIHPPKHLKLPELSFNILHFDKHSTLGAEDSIFVNILRKTPNGPVYVPVAFVGDNPKALDFCKIMFKNTVPDDNFNLVEKDQLQIATHGRNLFCGWTKPINLGDNLSLPPASILLEGYGEIKTRSFSLVYPAGFTLDQIRNYYESFVTFFHPASKYSGPGTDSIFARDIIMDLYKQK